MLSLKNVTIENKNKVAILNNLSLEIRTGDFIVIGGENKKEREMLVSVLGLNEELSMGEMYVDGIELSKITPTQKLTLKRDEFGFMTDSAILEESLSVKDNILMPLLFAGIKKEDQTAKLERVLAIVGLSDFSKVLVKDLTNWQKNKVMIARAIVNQPKTVIFSEPYRMTGVEKIDEVLGLLKGLNKDGVTVIVSSNLEEYVSVAKRKVVITGGNIIELKKERQPKEQTAKPKAKTKKTTKTTKKETPVKKQETIIVEQFKPEVEEVLAVKPEEALKVEEPKKVAKKETKTPKETKKEENVSKKASKATKKEVEVASKNTAKKTTAKKKTSQDNNSEQLSLDLEIEVEKKPARKTKSKKEVDTNGANN